MNSLKSVCSFTQRLPIAKDEIEQDLQPFRGLQGGVVDSVGLVGRGQRVKRLRMSLHG